LNHCDVIGSKGTEFSEIAQYNASRKSPCLVIIIIIITAITPFKIIQGHKVTNFGSHGKPACNFLCVSNIVINLLSCAVSEIWRIIGSIFAVDRGCLPLIHSFGVNR